MKFERLLNEEKIERIEKAEFDSTPAERDLKFAKIGLKTEDYDRVMAIAYEAVLRIASRLMNFLGYRAIGKEHHKNVFKFLEELNIDRKLTHYFDNIRKKRNDFIYRDVEVVSREEAEEIIERAEEFVQKIRTFVQKIRTEENGGRT